MIKQFEEWSTHLAEAAPFEQLTGSVAGIEAADYLRSLPKATIPTIDRPIKEVLVPALGPTPFGLKSAIKASINVWRQKGIEPLFVFSGLEVGKREAAFAASEEAARINANAWNLYYNNDADASVTAFGKSDAVTPESLFRYLQVVLREENVDFLVAPYGAWAQVRFAPVLGRIYVWLTVSARLSLSNKDR